MNVPADLRYAPSHEWARLEGDLVTMGISDHAQAELTDVVFLELPAPGASVRAGERVAVIESVKSANEIYSPVTGQIVEVNTPLSEDPAPVNADPYGAGWMIRIRVSGPEALAHLLTAEAYRSALG
jgi:glycine cleavage system H protein